MARYIDADKIVFWIRYVSSNGMLCDTDVRKVAFSDEIARIPTADVAPRAEVEKLQEVNADLNESLRLACEANKDLQAEVERLQIEIQALNIANEKMYIANKESKAEVVKEIIGIIGKRNESNNEHACGVKSEILSALYRGKEDAYRDIKEILEQKYMEEK